MIEMLSQIDDGLMSTIIWVVLALVFMVFGPRIMTTQAVLKLEREVFQLEDIADKSRLLVLHSVSKKPDKKLRKEIKNFMNFFAISPVSMDPYGLMKKIGNITKQSDQRIMYFVNEIVPNYSFEEKQNVKNALVGAITTHTIAKIVRHYLELIKKYKMFQLAMVIQMQIPMIMRVSRASMKATHAFVDGVPIGDGAGPLVAASMIKGRASVYKEDEFAVYKTKIDGRTVWISKADGPGASTGYPGNFLTKFLKKNRINRIISVDAALKMEGEKTASIAEGVGVAMGGSGADRFDIEEIAVKKNIPLDAIAIKMSDEEALGPMKKSIFDSVPRAQERIRKAIKRSKKGDRILVIGVGNTCGVGNSYKSMAKTKEKLRKHVSKVEPKKKKRFGI